MRLSARDFSQVMSNTTAELPIRRDLRWNFDDVPVTFVGDDVLISYLWITLSIGAPAVERLFVQSLRPLVERVADAQLSRDLDGMLTQESMHAAVHAKFNRTLAAKGLSVERAEAYVDGLVARLTSKYTPMEMVGIVAAGENVMYNFARVYLSNPAIGEQMTSSAQRLYEYHMLEEFEHMSVSRDVFEYFNGDDYAKRVEMAVPALIIIVQWFVTLMGILLQDGPYEVSWRDWLNFCRYGLIEPGVFVRLGLGIAEYFSPFQAAPDAPALERLRNRCETRLYATQPA